MEDKKQYEPMLIDWGSMFAPIVLDESSLNFLKKAFKDYIRRKIKLKKHRYYPGNRKGKIQWKL